MSSFRITAFDPIIVVLQIIVLQLSFWFTLGIFMLVPYSLLANVSVKNSLVNSQFFGLFTLPKHLDFFVSWKRNSWSTQEDEMELLMAGGAGLKKSLLVLVTTLAHAVFFARIFIARYVRRAKLVLDFASTLFFFHVIFCILSSDGTWPGILPFLAFILEWTIIVLYGQSVCMEIELRPISINNTSLSNDEYELL